MSIFLGRIYFGSRNKNLGNYCSSRHDRRIIQMLLGKVMSVRNFVSTVLIFVGRIMFWFKEYESWKQWFLIYVITGSFLCYYGKLWFRLMKISSLNFWISLSASDRTANRVSIFDRVGGQPVKTQVCTYWLAGRCKRNPCRFLHRELPPPQSHETQLAPPKDICGMQSKKKTWRRPNYYNQSSRQKAQSEVLTAVRTEPEKLTTQKGQPKQCKYWVTGNCVQGDKCKDLHSWFSGSGFTLLRKLEGHTKAITGISFPSGSEKLYSCSKDKSIRAWDSHTGQCAGSVITDGEAGCSISEGPWLLVGLQSALKGWKLQTQADFSFSLLPGLVCSMVLDDDKLFAGMEDGSLLMWKLNLETVTLEAAEQRKEHHGAVCSLVLGSNNRLYSGSRDGTIRVWDRQNLQCLHTLYGHTRDVMAIICWDNYLLSASLDNTLKIWAATESGSIEVIHEIKEDCGFTALCGIHDAEAKPILLCACNDNTVRLYDLPSFTERGRIFSKREVEVIEIGSNGLFFTGDASGEIAVWKLLGDPCEETAL
ncbi:Zinc finger CCCH domain-containing protein 17 [Sesamum angolense]|uniref:Zinc finger CCCH domain-containing protein 17 n=1 Tax=Sesamum angolense TaxID=2727404 RepID=A0AAE1XH77_9LAMI|nr:Zinc finger CCCH domain-containing protein 17 [Sesamum angolense]